MAVLKNCCFCVSLRNGSITLGILGFVLALAAIGICAGCLIVLNDDMLYKRFTEDEDRHKPFTFVVSAYSNAVLISGMFSNIVIFILSGFMVYGAVKGYQVFLLPWLALEVIAIIGVAIGAILGALYLPSVFGVSLLLVGILLMTVTSYFWLVVFSYYQELQGQDREVGYSPVELTPNFRAAAE